MLLCCSSNGASELRMRRVRRRRRMMMVMVVMVSHRAGFQETLEKLSGLMEEGESPGVFDEWI